jgi:hypothetical protein
MVAQRLLGQHAVVPAGGGVRQPDKIAVPQFLPQLAEDSIGGKITGQGNTLTICNARRLRY